MEYECREGNTQIGNTMVFSNLPKMLYDSTLTILGVDVGLIIFSNLVHFQKTCSSCINNQNVICFKRALLILEIGTLFSEEVWKASFVVCLCFREHLQKTYLLWCYAVHQNCLSIASLETTFRKFYKLYGCDFWFEINVQACNKASVMWRIGT